jgi:excisionase family DNA binding protein
MPRNFPKDGISENRLTLPVAAQDYGSESAQPLLLTVKEAAVPMRIGRDTTYALVTQGRIPSVKLGKQIRIPRAALLDHLVSAATKISTTAATKIPADGHQKSPLTAI